MKSYFISAVLIAFSLISCEKQASTLHEYSFTIVNETSYDVSVEYVYDGDSSNAIAKNETNQINMCAYRFNSDDSISFNALNNLYSCVLSIDGTTHSLDKSDLSKYFLSEGHDKLPNCIDLVSHNFILTLTNDDL
jgi:hypothetical protein